MGRPPVYYISHGGPTIMEDKQHPAYAKLQEIGREITQKVKPKAVVVFSGHWQGAKDVIEVNTSEDTGIIYDFGGFPSRLYEMKYPYQGSSELAKNLLDKLKIAGVKAKGVRRGLDHGVWAAFMVLFDPKENPLNVPIVQASLFGHEDPSKHYELGKAISSLRNEGVQIIVSGMAVHNLGDFRAVLGRPGALDYVYSFDEALREAVEQPPEKRKEAMKVLTKRPDARRAHPSFDHLLPIHVGAGAASEEQGRRLWTLAEGSWSWAQFRFGDVVA